MAIKGKTQRVKVSDDDKAELEQLKARIAQLEAEKKEKTIIVETPAQDNGKIPLDDLITVMSLLSYTLVLSTRERGQGNSYKFTSFGETKRILYSDLISIMEVRRNFLEWGFFVILDKRVIKQHGLQDIYSKIITKEKIEEIFSGSKNALDLYNSCNEQQQKEIITMVVEKIAVSPDAIDLNFVDKLTRVSGSNIMDMVNDTRANMRTREEVSAQS